VTVLLTKDEFQRLDTFCTESAFKKSTLIARLIRQYLDSQITSGAALPVTNRIALRRKTE